MQTYEIRHTSPSEGTCISYVVASSVEDAVAQLCATHAESCASVTPTILQVCIAQHRHAEPWLVCIWVNGVPQNTPVLAFSYQDAVHKAVRAVYTTGLTITVGSITRQ